MTGDGATRREPVTVGIPAYRATWLSQCIASILSQTKSDFELLISDDSPDGSVRPVVAQFADPRIRVLDGPRRGLVANSVHLWEHATHDLLKFVYDDDFLLPFALAEFQAAMTSRPGAPLAFARRHVVDPSGKVVLSPQIFQGNRLVTLNDSVLSRSAILTLHSPVGEPSNMIIRRSAFGSPACLHSYAGLPVRHLIDVCLSLNSADAGPVVGLPNYLSAFRRHPDQATEARNAPAFSAGIFEWELFIRGAIDAGKVSTPDALGAVTKLLKAYDRRGLHFSELLTLRPGLKRLGDDLQTGTARGLTDAFRSRYLTAAAMIDARLAAPATLTV